MDDDGDELDELLVRLGAMVVCSGNKRHAYVALDDTYDTDVVVDLNTRLKDALPHGDHKQQHNSLLRLPGSLNFKTDPPLPVEITPPASKVWSAEQLDGLLPKPAPKIQRRTYDVRQLEPVNAIPEVLEAAARADTPRDRDLSGQTFAFVSRALSACFTPRRSRRPSPCTARP